MNLALVCMSLGGKRTGKKDEFLLNCWLCDGHDKLYFNVKKGVGYCQKCTKTIDLRSLFMEAGIPVEQAKTAIAEMQLENRDAEVAGMGVVDFVATKLFKERRSKPCIPELPAAVMPEGYFTLEEVQNFTSGKRALDYMLSRGFKKSVLFDMQFGVCVEGHYAKRVIIPFWENNRIVYWQARDYTGKQEMKILNPFKNHCLVGKSEVLFNYEGAQKCDVVVVTESWGSSLAVGKCAVGLNGKSMSEMQFLKLLNLPASAFLLMLDAGTLPAAVKIARRLAESRKVLIADLPYGDPNEVPKSVINKVIANAKVYSQDFTLEAMATALKTKCPA